MRLQLTLLAILLDPAGASAQGGSVALRSSTYADDDATVISTSTVAVRGRPVDSVTLHGRYLLDAVSSASVDVVTAATERWTELRHEAEGGVAFADGTRVASGSYIYSVENDWESHTGSVGFAHDLLSHNLTVGVGGSFVHNRIWRADDPSFRRELRVYGGSLTLTGTPSPRDLLSVGYTTSLLRGYQASPYRLARFLGPGGALPLAHEEVHPERRLRHSVTLRHNHRASEVTTLRSHLRLYGDDWGVRSVTAGVEVVLDLGEVEIGGHVRGYLQNAASFYEDEYAQERTLMTADRELSRFYDVFTGARLGWRREPTGGAVEALRLDFELTGFAFFFPEFSELPRRLGLVGEIGFGVEL